MRTFFEVKFDVVYQLHVHDVFQQSQQNVFSTWTAFSFLEVAKCFCQRFRMFLEFDEKMRMNKDVCGTTW